MTLRREREKARIEKAGDVFYFLFQTLPALAVLVALTVIAVGYALVKIVL